MTNGKGRGVQGRLKNFLGEQPGRRFFTTAAAAAAAVGVIVEVEVAVPGAGREMGKGLKLRNTFL